MEAYLERVGVPDFEFRSKAVICEEPICSVQPKESVKKSSEGCLLYIVPESEEPVKIMTTYYPLLHKPPITFEVMLK
jgi:hypothetical protein